MKLPREILLSSIKDFCILYFKDADHDPKAPPHFYLSFPINEFSSIVICIITSQVDKRTDFYRKTNYKATRALVRINNDVFAFLDRESIIDCNRAEILSHEELIKRIDPKIEPEIKTREVPQYLQHDVKRAIIQSPLIPVGLKKLVKEMG